MKTYIAFLRGINVGGHRSLKMENLRQMFAMLGFENVSTYIQSGNVIFDAIDQDESRLAAKIKDQIEETFDYDVPVIIRTADELRRIFAEFPFEEKEGWRGYITFLSDQPTRDQKKELEAQSSDIEIFKVGNRAVCAHVNKQADEKPLFSSNFIQKQLNIPATNRNLRTIRKILELAEK